MPRGVSAILRYVGGVSRETQKRPPSEWFGWAMATLSFAVHFALAGRYDYHRDELYFIECGRHLAFGYVDHPPLVPFIAWLADVTTGANLYALRLLPALACGVTVLVASHFVRELGGGRWATVLTGLALIAAPAYQRMGVLLCIPVFEPVFWTLASLWVWKILHGGSDRRWLLVGVVVGLGLMGKHSMLLWVAGISGGLLFTSERRRLLGPWPWLGLAAALLIFSPNFVWQARHDFATFQFLRGLQHTTLAKIPASLFLLGQLLFLDPLSAPMWIWGLVSLAMGDPRRRVFAIAFLAVMAILLVTHGKPYYLAPAYPVLFAAGATAIEKRFRDRRAPLVIATSVLASGAMVFGFIGFPLLPVATIDRVLSRTLGAFTRPEELTRELHDEYGWREQVETVASIVDTLPREERDELVVLTANYGEASAINFFGKGRGLPRAVSGHMNYYLWGVPPGRGNVVIAYGMPRASIERLYGDVREVGRIDHPLAMPEERNLPVFIGRSPRIPLSEAWPTLERYQHGRVRN